MSADPGATELAIGAEVPIAVRDHGGQGTDVLLLPGGLQTMDDWRLVVPLLLDAGLRVTAMDPRSQGRSGNAPWQWSAVRERCSRCTGPGPDRDRGPLTTTGPGP